MICKYCKINFNHKRSLYRHQQTAQYCLRIQGKISEIEGMLNENKCQNCDKRFSRKENLFRHEKMLFNSSSNK